MGKGVLCSIMFCGKLSAATQCVCPLSCCVTPHDATTVSHGLQGRSLGPVTQSGCLSVDCLPGLLCCMHSLTTDAQHANTSLPAQRTCVHACQAGPKPLCM